MKRREFLNPYFILRVSSQSETTEIKRAYRKLIQIYHPDKNRGNELAEKKFKLINSAWETLKDPKKREAFDKELKQFREIKVYQKKDIKTPLSSSRIIREKPIDLEVTLTVSLEDLCQCRPKTIKYLKPVRGKKEKSYLEVDIPWGAKEGDLLFFKGKGGGKGENLFGNLYVKLKVAPHQIFQLIKTKENRDLFLEWPISFIEAFEENEKQVLFPYGRVKVKCPRPLKNNQILKIKNHGLPKTKEVRGALFVKIIIDYPLKHGIKIKKEMADLSLEEKKLYIERVKKNTFIYPLILKREKILEKFGKDKK